MKNTYLHLLILIGGLSIQNNSLTSAPQGQSPIALDTSTAYSIDVEDIEFFYPKALTVDVTANHHTVQCSPAAKNPRAYIIQDGQEFDFMQVHTHTYSEHTIDGVRAPAELHLVHKNKKTGELAVIGVMVNHGTETTSGLVPLMKLLESTQPQGALPDSEDPVESVEADFILPHSPDEPSVHTLGTITLSLSGLLPKNKQTFRYPGSLTTPPYTEGVRWNIMVDPIIARPAFSEKIIALTAPVTARELQDIKDRPVILDAA
jgi:carbonic anhydrase